jgi:hypothetical protein
MLNIIKHLCLKTFIFTGLVALVGLYIEFEWQGRGLEYIGGVQQGIQTFSWKACRQERTQES